MFQGFQTVLKALKKYGNSEMKKIMNFLSRIVFYYTD